VVKSKLVPERIKESISIESGLNDGIALPPILSCIAVLSVGGSAITGDGRWLKFMAMQLTVGPVIGALVGYIGGKIVDYSTNKNWMGSVFHQLVSFSLAILAYSCAEMFHGNGFIAAFFAGLMLGTNIRIVRERIQEFGEAQGQLFSLIIFFLLGLVAVPGFYPYWDINTFIYSLLSLTAIRIIPVMLSLIGTELNLYSKLFIGWFGPRGIASILYMLIVISDLGIAGYEKLMSVIVLTVLISTFVHGLSAVYMSKQFSSH
jgi:NhaP-type Na+/H+ or K+/H+ antiporter